MLTSCPKLVVLSSLLALAACSGAPGEQIAQEDQAAGVWGPGGVGGGGFLVVPTRYSVSNSQAVKMLPSATYYCLLDGVSGALGGAGPFVVPNVNGAQSFADIFDDGTDFWLISGVGVTATASCISWSNFTGPGVVASAVQTTTRAPYTVVVESGNGSNQAGSVSMWAAGDAVCVLSALEGQMTGVSLGPTPGPYNDVSVVPDALPQGLLALTNSPYLSASANCVTFPGRWSMASSTYILGSGYNQPESVALPSRATALCGLSSLGGVLASNGDGITIVPSGNGGQTASVSGGIGGGLVTCMPYAQP